MLFNRDGQEWAGIAADFMTLTEQVPAGADAAEVYRRMDQLGTDTLVTAADGGVVGIIHRDDDGSAGEPARTRPHGPEPLSPGIALAVPADEPADHALAMMRSLGLAQLVVICDNQPIGVLERAVLEGEPVASLAA